MATKSQAYGLIHTARFGNHAANIEPLEFVRPLSEICLRSRPAVLSFEGWGGEVLGCKLGAREHRVLVRVLEGEVLAGHLRNPQLFNPQS